MAQDITDPSHILEYKPKIEYKLDDINAIDNVADDPIESLINSVVNSGTANNVVRLEQTKALLNETKLALDKKLEGTVAQFNKEILDSSMMDELARLTDASKLINDGIITYPLYKEIKDDPVFALIKDAWDEYHCGINGSIGAELLPYTDIVQEIIDNITELINNAVLYDEDPQAISDSKKLRDSEIALTEKYVHLRTDIKDAMSHSDYPKYTLAKKQFEVVENKIKYRKNMNLVLSNILGKLTSIIRSIQDGIIDEYRTIQHATLANQIQMVRRNIEVGTTALRAITYSSFMKQYDTVINQKRNYENLIDKNIRNSTFQSSITGIRLYRDVAVPAMVELTCADDELPVGIVGDTLASGIEQMVNNHEKSMLAIKNMLESEACTINNLVNEIYEKDRARSMYKIMRE